MNKVRAILKKRRTKVTIYLAIIVGLTLAVYYPSFFHLLRGETYTYFMDSMGDHSAVSLVGNYYNYEMVRVFDAGDSLVFRPLLFTVLGIETALFGANYIWWHIAAFIMHLTATLCLFRLLWKIRPTIIALFATLFFSTSFIVLAPILYEQIASYALFTGLVLTTLYYIYCGVQSGKTKHLVFAAVSMLVACFSLEVGVVLLILFIGYFWFERKRPSFKWRKWAFVFLAILCVYSASYTAETLLDPTSTTSKDLDKLLASGNVIPVVSNGQRLATYWITQSAYPANFTGGIDTNFRANPVSIVPTFQEWIGYRGTTLIYFETKRENATILVVLNYVALVIIGAALFLSPRYGKPRLSTPFLFLLTLTPFMVALANAFYRGTTLDRAYLLSDANYNIYMWFALFILVAYAFISLKRLAVWHKGLISLALIILISLSAPLTYRLNQEVKEDAEPIRAYFQEIDRFIGVHRPEDEPYFSFKSTINSPDQEERMGILLWKGLPGEDEYTPYNFTMPEVLYWRYWDNENPKYTLLYHSEEGRLEVIENE